MWVRLGAGGMMGRSKQSWIGLGIAALALVACGSDPQGADAIDDSALASTAAQKTVLALGDSIAFGFNPLVTTPNVPSSYIGYPEVIATKGISVTNASCPGETSGSFLSATAADNGCRNWKAAYSLHADYETTQLAFSLAAVKKTKYDYITVNIGANDLFLLQASCAGAPACIQAGLPAVIAAYSANLQNGYNQIKAAGFKGKWAVLTTYATNYNDPLSVGALTLLNQALSTFATTNGGKIADGFAAFKTASTASAGDPCAAGLLIKMPDGTCNIHPSQKGRELLATTLVNLVK
jgi:lysophospholipase L1-like esterase